MKPATRPDKIVRLVVTSAVLLFGRGGAVFCAPTGSVNLSAAGIEGAPTNGISGWVSVDAWSYLVNVSVRIVHGEIQFTNSSRRLEPQWKYFLATNSFCGPLELRDAAGRDVPPRKPGVESLTSYPASFDLRSVRSNFHWAHLHAFYSGPEVPEPIIVRSMPLASFYLSDYFAMRKPGRYTLIVWPKIYARKSAADTVCQRIDIPPVTAAVDWQGKR